MDEVVVEEFGKEEIKNEEIKKEEPKVDVKPEPEKKRSNIALKGGKLQPANDDQLYRVARQLISGKAVPKWFTTPEQVYSAMAFLGNLGVPMQTNLSQVAMVQGVPSIFGDLPLDLVLNGGELELHDEFVFDAEYKKISFENGNLNAAYIGAVCIVKRKEQKQRSFSFTIEDAKTAGLWGMKSASGSPMPWSLYPKLMLVRRARSMALKTVFPDFLRGAKITEYDFHQAPDMRDVNNPETPSTENYISAKYGKEPVVQRGRSDAPQEVETPNGDITLEGGPQ
jgi:hypothetical protein